MLARLVLGRQAIKEREDEQGRAGAGREAGERAPVIVVTFASNRVDFVALQHETLTAFLAEPFVLLVVNDGPDANLREKIHELCRSLATRHNVIEVPSRAGHTAPYDAAIRCGETINWVLREYVHRHWPRSQVVLMDNDMFLTAPFSVRAFLNGYAAAGIPQDKPSPCRPRADSAAAGGAGAGGGRGLSESSYVNALGSAFKAIGAGGAAAAEECRMRYPWNALVLLDLAALPEVDTMDWLPGMVNGTMGDVGVRVIEYFARHSRLRMRAMTGVTLPCVTVSRGAEGGDGAGQGGLWGLMEPQVRRECAALQRRGAGREISFQLWEGAWVHFLSSSNWWLGPRLYLSELHFSPEKLAVFEGFVRRRVLGPHGERQGFVSLAAWNDTCPLPPLLLEPYSLPPVSSPATA